MAFFTREAKNSGPYQPYTPLDSLDEKADLRILWLFLSAFLLIISGLGARDPWPADEPRFAQIALEMVQSGEWLIPSRGGEFYPDKPPLLMWLMAIGMKVTGSIRFGFLLPSILAGFITVAIITDLARRLWRYEVGIFAGFLTLVVFQFTMQSKVAQTDSLFTMWLTLGIYGLMRHLVLGPSWGWYGIAWIAMGLGALTKIAGFLPAFVLIPFVLMNTKLHGCIRFRWSQMGWWLLGPILFFLVVGAWLGPVWLRAHSGSAEAIHDYLHNILWIQTFHRYQGLLGHNHPFFYYVLEVLPWAWFPISLFLFWLVPEWYRRIKEMDAKIVLPLSYVLFLVLFFSISPGKRGVYMLPTAPIIALISASYLFQHQYKPSLQRMSHIAVGLMCCFYVGLALFALSLDESRMLEYEIPSNLKNIFWVLGGLNFLIFLFFRKRNGFHGLWLSMVLFWLITSWFIAPAINRFRTPVDVLSRAEQVLQPTSELAILDLREQFLLFSPRPIMHFGKHTAFPNKVAEAIRWLNEKDDRWLLINQEELGECFAVDQTVELGFRHRQDWYLAGPQANTGFCERDYLTAPRYLPKVK